MLKCANKENISVLPCSVKAPLSGCAAQQISHTRVPQVRDMGCPSHLWQMQDLGKKLRSSKAAECIYYLYL